MDFLIEDVIRSILNYASPTGCKLTVKRVDDDGYVIHNQEAERVVALGRLNVKVDGEKKEIVGAFTINIKRYKWADAEGFTQDQMIDELSGEIFDLIGVDETFDYLCPE